MKIPQLTWVDITPDAFKKEAMKLGGDAPPGFSIHDVVMLQGILGTQSPALIVGISLRMGGWTYDVIRFRTHDGQLERVDCIAEKNITAHGEK